MPFAHAGLSCFQRRPFFLPWRRLSIFLKFYNFTKRHQANFSFCNRLVIEGPQDTVKKIAFLWVQNCFHYFEALPLNYELADFMRNFQAGFCWQVQAIEGTNSELTWRLCDLQGILSAGKLTNSRNKQLLQLKDNKHSDLRVCQQQFVMMLLTFKYCKFGGENSKTQLHHTSTPAYLQVDQKKHQPLHFLRNKPNLLAQTNPNHFLLIYKISRLQYILKTPPRVRTLGPNLDQNPFIYGQTYEYLLARIFQFCNNNYIILIRAKVK